MTVFPVPAEILGLILLFAFIIVAAVLLVLGVLSTRGKIGPEMRKKEEKEAAKEEQKPSKSADASSDT